MTAASGDPTFEVAGPKTSRNDLAGPGTSTYSATAPGTSTYDVAGPVDASSIVFVHGTWLARSSWSAQLADLADAYRVIAMDLPGHGTLADRPFTLRAAADELERVIVEAAGERAVVVGLSLGGYVAMDLAARRPDLIRALVLAGATQEPVGLRARPYLALAWAVDRLAGHGLARLDRWLLRVRYAPAIADPILADAVQPTGGSVALRALVGERFVPRLAAYPGPVLIVNGEWDLLFRLGARAFSSVARDARRVRVRGAGHLVNLDRPEAFNAAVRHFVERLPVGS
jgi:pimeloyl-ACP methyl ester carboxylesterase